MGLRINVTIPASAIQRAANVARMVARLKDDPTEAYAGPVKKALEPAYQQSFVELRGPIGGEWAPPKRAQSHPLGVRTTALATPRVFAFGGAGGWTVVVKAAPKYSIFFHRKRHIVPLGEALGRWQAPVDAALEQGSAKLAARLTGRG
jgi:hypothetical protein